MSFATRSPGDGTVGLLQSLQDQFRRIAARQQWSAVGVYTAATVAAVAVGGCSVGDVVRCDPAALFSHASTMLAGAPFTAAWFGWLKDDVLNPMIEIEETFAERYGDVRSAHRRRPEVVRAYHRKALEIVRARIFDPAHKADTMSTRRINLLVLTVPMVVTALQTATLTPSTVGFFVAANVLTFLASKLSFANFKRHASAVVAVHANDVHIGAGRSYAQICADMERGNDALEHRAP